MGLEFAFCESVSASGSSPWHIRPLEVTPALRPTGGVDTSSLCGHVRPPSGWDINVRFSSTTAKQVHICSRCRDLYEDYLRVGDLYFEQDGKKYVRLRDIEGLEKQLLDGLARIEWYSLQRPGTDRPFFLLEFEMKRRMHKTSQRWFNGETFRIRVPADKVSEAFLNALSSRPSGASSSTGTSSARPVKPSVKKTTGASRR